MRRFLSILGLLALLSPLIAGWPQPVAAARRITPNPLLRAVNLSAARMGLLGAVPSARRVVLQTAAVADGLGTNIDVAGMGTVAAQITGLGAATIHWEATVNRTDWVAISATNITSAVPGTTATADGIYSLSASGASLVRARISDWTSGTITVVAIAVPLGGAGAGGGGGGGGATTVADGADVALGTTTDAAVQDGPGTAIAHLRGLNEILFDIWDQTNHVANFGMATVLDPTQDAVAIAFSDGTKIPKGQATMANSLPVAIASNQGNLPANIAQVGGASLTFGQAVMANSLPVAIASNQGSLTTSSSNWPTTVDTNSGNKSASTPRVVIATDQPNLTTALNVSAAQSGTWTVQPGNTANTTPWLFSPQAATAGGATPYSYVAAASANQDSQVIKNGAGQLYSIEVFNTSAALKWLKVYDKATAPTSADTTLIVARYPVPFNSTASNSAGLVSHFTVGRVFTSGISFRMTGAAADNDATAVTAGDLVINAGWK